MELNVHGLHKHFGSKTVLDYISLAMRSGEFMAFVGSSGS